MSKISISLTLILIGAAVGCTDNELDDAALAAEEVGFAPDDGLATATIDTALVNSNNNAIDQLPTSAAGAEPNLAELAPDPAEGGPTEVLDVTQEAGAKAPLQMNKTKAACAAAVAGCAVAIVAADLGCAAAAESVGFLTPLCLTGIAQASLACGAAIPLNCGTSNNRNVYSAGRRGGTPVDGDTYTEHLCSGDSRVRRANFWTKTFSAVGGAKLISSIEITCNDKGTDTVYSFVGNKTNTTNNGSTCGTNPWNLVQGFTIRAGSAVDAMGVQCDKTWDTATANWNGVIVGGSGGSSASTVCNEGDYVVGLRTWNDSNKYVRAVQVMCAQALD